MGMLRISTGKLIINFLDWSLHWHSLQIATCITYLVRNILHSSFLIEKTAKTRYYYAKEVVSINNALLRG